MTRIFGSSEQLFSSALPLEGAPPPKRAKRKQVPRNRMGADFASNVGRGPFKKTIAPLPFFSFSSASVKARRKLRLTSRMRLETAPEFRGPLLKKSNFGSGDVPIFAKRLVAMRHTWFIFRRPGKSRNYPPAIRARGRRPRRVSQRQSRFAPGPSCCVGEGKKG